MSVFEQVRLQNMHSSENSWSRASGIQKVKRELPAAQEELTEVKMVTLCP